MESVHIPSLGHMGHIKLRDLRPDRIQRYYTAKLEDGAGAATVRMSHVCFLKILTISNRIQTFVCYNEGKFV